MKAFRQLRYKIALRYSGQTCAECFRNGRDALWFFVPDSVWEAVAGDEGRALCLSCFDRKAEAAGVNYSADLVMQGRGSWMA